jgi:hypothetical protein
MHGFFPEIRRKSWLSAFWPIWTTIARANLVRLLNFFLRRTSHVVFSRFVNLPPAIHSPARSYPRKTDKKWCTLNAPQLLALPMSDSQIQSAKRFPVILPLLFCIRFTLWTRTRITMELLREACFSLNSSCTKVRKLAPFSGDPSPMYPLSSPGKPSGLRLLVQLWSNSEKNSVFWKFLQAAPRSGPRKLGGGFQHLHVENGLATSIPQADTFLNCY